MRPFHREITAWLREYGATDVALASGGKHPRVEFRFAGRPYRFVVPGTPGDHRSGDNTIAMIRRTLGAPLPAPERCRRTVEDMMSETVEKAAHLVPLVRGSVARYGRNGKSAGKLKFTLPPTDAARFFWGTASRSSPRATAGGSSTAPRCRPRSSAQRGIRRAWTCSPAAPNHRSARRRRSSRR